MIINKINYKYNNKKYVECGILLVVYKMQIMIYSFCS